MTPSRRRNEDACAGDARGDDAQADAHQKVRGRRKAILCVTARLVTGHARDRGRVLALDSGDAVTLKVVDNACHP